MGQLKIATIACCHSVSNFEVQEQAQYRLRSHHELIPQGSQEELLEFVRVGQFQVFMAPAQFGPTLRISAAKVRASWAAKM